jgi:hypothetical protein
VLDESSIGGTPSRTPPKSTIVRDAFQAETPYYRYEITENHIMSLDLITIGGSPNDLTLEEIDPTWIGCSPNGGTKENLN